MNRLRPAQRSSEKKTQEGYDIKRTKTSQQTQNGLSTDTRDRQLMSAIARQTEWFKFESQRRKENLQKIK